MASCCQPQILMSLDLQATRPLLYFLTLLSIIVEKFVCCAAIENQLTKDPEPFLQICLMIFSNLLHLCKGFSYAYSHYSLGCSLSTALGRLVIAVDALMQRNLNA